jgi:transcriptional regulator with XRE-family HTH domain
MEKSIYSDNHKQFLQLLRELREEAELRQEDVAEELEVPQSFVSKYESGERRLDVLELRAVCKVLKLELTTFCRKLERRIAEDD